MDSLILTLGHNSSAIAVRDGKVLGGYETERFTGKKSDSAYPALPMEALLNHFDMDRDAPICIGHWFLNAQLPADSNKYLNYEHIYANMAQPEILSLDKEFSHHDSHIESAMVFAGDDFADEYHTLVLDGFGSFGECISVYKVTGSSYTLLNRWFGFEKSLGMLYQYATAYMGMKQHNHEYKILAYEVHVEEVGHDPNVLRHYAQEQAAKHVKTLIKGDMTAKYDPMISVEALPRIQQAIAVELDKFCDTFGVDKKNELEFRACVALYVQTFVESVVVTLLDIYKPTNVLLVGGLFYNVKLNSLVQKNIPGKLCAMPLAGDQGAGLGVYQKYMGDLVWPDHLFWGHRNLNIKTAAPGLIMVPTMAEAKVVIQRELQRIGFVNVVRGSMEFGPRALCNTTTFALPTRDVIDTVNMVNDRTTEMPCAPVMSLETANKVFDGVDKIHKSLEYMIVTRDYKAGYGEQYTGASHFYPDQGVYTGRPQITNDPDLLDILKPHEVLVNTSYNYHGVPIVFGEKEIIYTHLMQRQKGPHLDIKTVVVTG